MSEFNHSNNSIYCQNSIYTIFLSFTNWLNHNSFATENRKISARGAAGVAVTKRLVETPAISAVPKLLVQAERRVKLA